MKKYLLSLLGFLCISCHAYLFEEYQNIPDEEWCIRNPIRFKIDIPEDGTYELLSGIRHTTDYEMANLWCFIKISDSTRVLFPGHTEHQTGQTGRTVAGRRFYHQIH